MDSWAFASPDLHQVPIDVTAGWAGAMWVSFLLKETTTTPKCLEQGSNLISRPMPWPLGYAAPLHTHTHARTHTYIHTHHTHTHITHTHTHTHTSHTHTHTHTHKHTYDTTSLIHQLIKNDRHKLFHTSKKNKSSRKVAHIKMLLGIAFHQ